MKGTMNLLRSLLQTALQQRLALLFALALLTTTALHAEAPRDTSTRWIDHLTVEIGAGGTAAVGSTSNTVHSGFNIIEGIGYRRNERFSVLLEGSVSVDGLPRSILQQEGQPNGSYTFGSFAVDPLFNYIERGRWAGYVVGGGGFSIKQVAFTHPSPIDSYSYGYRVVAASESSNQPMFNVGTGATLRFHEDGRWRLFLETRYVKMFTPTGQFPGFGSANTELVPITLGARF